jgi:hypothetical protein
VGSHDPGGDRRPTKDNTLDQVELFFASDFRDFNGFIVWADFNDFEIEVFA